MERFEIRGGKRLSGEIDVRGSKNAALPILSATLLSRGEIRSPTPPMLLARLQVMHRALP
jgi:UDP-N-acetylglucosamine 1-carboxyvinyltransferase